MLDRWTPEVSQGEDFHFETYTGTVPLIKSKNLNFSPKSQPLSKGLPKRSQIETSFTQPKILRQRKDILSQSMIKLPRVMPNFNSTQPFEKKIQCVNRNCNKRTLKIKFIDISPFSMNGLRENKEKKIKKPMSLSSSFFKKTKKIV